MPRGVHIWYRWLVKEIIARHVPNGTCERMNHAASEREALLKYEFALYDTGMLVPWVVCTITGLSATGKGHDDAHLCWIILGLMSFQTSYHAVCIAMLERSEFQVAFGVTDSR